MTKAAKKQPTTTNLISTSRFSEQNLCERMVSHRLALDNYMHFTGGGALIFAETAPRIPSVYDVNHVSSALKLANERLLVVNTAAVQVFTRLAQCSDVSCLSSGSALDPEILDRLSASTQLPHEPEANFEAADEPIAFAWTKKGHEIRQAAKRYSEQTHADY